MNQFEVFVASSESARSDAWRYLRRLRELDNRIEEDMHRLREIAETVATSSVRSTTEQPLRENGSPCRGGKRKRAFSGRAESVAPARDDDESCDGASSDTSLVTLEPTNAQLFVEYRTRRHRVLRYALERVKVAEEIKACGNDVKESLAVHMTQLQRTLRGT
ncbi:hypothetical protein TraAM80_07789 [Trypanosoma rangeli]|uniref:Uncharacterized protein n=1 Tax=Trypanosoma rangeli TaxID=5698 RepID=A0A422N3V4_TRYRA|nr:uncharacterized protein TraAM80_07789 [Trypanosoma rangeli]RNF00148.1 hypothetical protein TraAM80_07789 [Trypanosoma rangeli]|eukprot:RNF00148.1 hypothetical protein TraAM80_07789 [Trypanosoma rangeli]